MKRRSLFRIFLPAGLFLVSSVAGAAVPPVSDHPVAVESAVQNPTFLRVTDAPGERISLEVGTWTLRPVDGVGPEIGLIGVAHIGESSLYKTLQRQLGGFDIVLYESVKPSGAGRPRGDTDAERWASTEASLEFLAGCTRLYRDQIDAYPGTSDDLIVGLQTIDARMAEWAGEALTDAWGHKVMYRRTDGGDSFSITSLGSDGAEGGSGHAADLLVDLSTQVAPVSLSSEDGIQAKLADVLGLEFQLDAIDYSDDTWRCSDMTMDQLNRSLRDNGVNSFELQSTLAGTGLSGRLAGALMKVVKLIDLMTDGQMSDIAKIAMIEVLGDESITQQALRTQLGEGFAKVLIGERNQVVVDDLKRLVSEHPETKSVGVFYGAAHMADFVERLKDQMNYEPVSVEWTTAIEVDLRNTALNDRDIQSMRTMLRQSLKFAR